MTALPSPPDPDWGYKFEETPRANTNRYGDGYSQRVGDGLNTMLRSTSLTYTDITTAQKETLRVFFQGLDGIDNFTWRPDGEMQDVIWYAPDWVAMPTKGELWTFTVNLREDPVP